MAAFFSLCCLPRLHRFAASVTPADILARMNGTSQTAGARTRDALFEGHAQVVPAPPHDAAWLASLRSRRQAQAEPVRDVSGSSENQPSASGGNVDDVAGNQAIDATAHDLHPAFYAGGPSRSLSFFRWHGRQCTSEILLISECLLTQGNVRPITRA